MRYRITRDAALADLLATLVLATACGQGTPTGTDLTRADLEKEISGMYEPDDPEATLTTACEGDLRAAAETTQDCTVTTGDQEVGIRAVVTDPDADDLGLETTPFLPPESVADAIASSLEVQGYDGVSVTCDGDLVGEVGRAVVCELVTPEGDSIVNVDVTSVDGLLINFDFKSA